MEIRGERERGRERERERERERDGLSISHKVTILETYPKRAASAITFFFFLRECNHSSTPITSCRSYVDNSRTDSGGSIAENDTTSESISEFYQVEEGLQWVWRNRACRPLERKRGIVHFLSEGRTFIAFPSETVRSSTTLTSQMQSMP